MLHNLSSLIEQNTIAIATGFPFRFLLIRSKVPSFGPEIEVDANIFLAITQKTIEISF